MTQDDIFSCIQIANLMFDLTLLCNFFVFQKNILFFVLFAKYVLCTFATPYHRYGKLDKHPQWENADRPATLKEGARKLRVGTNLRSWLI